jgi:hypothetical protein
MLRLQMLRFSEAIKYIINAYTAPESFVGV